MSILKASYKRGISAALFIEKSRSQRFSDFSKILFRFCLYGCFAIILKTTTKLQVLLFLGHDHLVLGTLRLSI